MKFQQSHIILVVFLVLLIGAVVAYDNFRSRPVSAVLAEPTENTDNETTDEHFDELIDDPVLIIDDNPPVVPPPLSNHQKRITKKPFGIWITPATSPIQPERFSGFHTGTDFEIFPEELNRDVSVSAICDGKIIFKQRVGGYGGVMVQSCTLKNKPVTVVYGHIDLNKSPAQLNEKTKTDQTIAVLASDKSRESDGERKHLHLSIHTGTGIDLKGYVGSESQLSQWLDFEDL